MFGAGFGVVGGSAGGERVVERVVEVEVERIVEVEKIVEIEVPAPTEFVGPYVEATGGVVTDYTDADGVAWREHMFADTAIFSVSAPGEVQVDAIGGGGGGGDAYGSGGSSGGGGAGGHVRATRRVGVNDYPVAIGAGAPYGYYVAEEETFYQVASHPAGSPSRVLGIEALGGESGFGDWPPMAFSTDSFYPVASTGGSAAIGWDLDPNLRKPTPGQGFSGSRQAGYEMSGGGGGAGSAAGVKRYLRRTVDWSGAEFVDETTVLDGAYPFSDEDYYEERDTGQVSYSRVRLDGGAGLDVMTAAGLVGVCGGGAGSADPEWSGRTGVQPIASHGGGLPGQNGASNTGAGGGAGETHGGSGVVYIRYRRQA